jgi:hypothetical protein
MIDYDESFYWILIFGAALVFVITEWSVKRRIQRKIARINSPRIYTWYAADNTEAPVLTSHNGEKVDSHIEFQWMWRNEYGITDKAAARAVRMESMAATGQTHVSSIAFYSSSPARLYKTAPTKCRQTYADMAKHSIL